MGDDLARWRDPIGTGPTTTSNNQECAMQQADLDNRFTFHPVKGDQGETYGAIRAKALEFANFINGAAPDSRELSLAVTHIEEAVFWANAAIARNA